MTRYVDTYFNGENTIISAAIRTLISTTRDRELNHSTAVL